MTDQATRVVPAGWYDDPASPTRVRWWNGIAWTEHVADKPSAEDQAAAAARAAEERAAAERAAAERDAVARQHAPGELDASVRQPMRARQHRERRRFARSVRPDQGDRTTRRRSQLEAQVDVAAVRLEVREEPTR